MPLIIGTNRDEAALFRWMKSPLMPIAPKTIRAMFDEIAAEQPGLQLPSEAEIGSAYSGIRTRACGLHVARDVGFRMPTVWFAEGHARSPRCICTGSTGPPRCCGCCASAPPTPPNCLMSGAIS